MEVVVESVPYRGWKSVFESVVSLFFLYGSFCLKVKGLGFGLDFFCGGIVTFRTFLRLLFVRNGIVNFICE